MDKKEWSVVLESSADFTNNFFIAKNGVRVAKVVEPYVYKDIGKEVIAKSIVDKLNAYNQLLMEADKTV